MSGELSSLYFAVRLSAHTSEQSVFVSYACESEWICILDGWVLVDYRLLDCASLFHRSYNGYIGIVCGSLWGSGFIVCWFVVCIVMELQLKINAYIYLKQF